MQLKIRCTELLLQYAEKLTTHFLKEENLMKSKKKFVRLLCAVLTLCMISAITKQTNCFLMPKLASSYRVRLPLVRYSANIELGMASQGLFL